MGPGPSVMVSLATSLGTPRVESATRLSLSESSQGGVLHVGESKTADSNSQSSAISAGLSMLPGAKGLEQTRLPK